MCYHLQDKLREQLKIKQKFNYLLVTKTIVTSISSKLAACK